MRFHDRHEHLDYLKAELVARRIIDTPSVIEEARAFIDRFWRDDPHAAHYLAIWDRLLDCPPAEIAARLLEDSEAGRYLRETRPPFGVTTAQQVARLIERLPR
ncbi:MAG TPA: hypothetical protein VGN83_26420 [Falsiroseomonas sp.]|jgi:hypothetical protein|nr:hypothetical protein [Falsiroseomonas sp.]